MVSFALCHRVNPIGWFTSMAGPKPLPIHLKR